MSRKLSRRQKRQNAAFLAALAETGNVRLAARTLGVHRSTFTQRRAKHPDFAAGWDAALAVAHARFERDGGARPPGTVTRDCPPSRRLRTRGGEPTIVRLRSGRLQLREALTARMTGAAREAFFEILGQTANRRLAAEAAGFAASSFVYRRRADPGFAASEKDCLARAQAEIERSVQAAIEAAREPRIPTGAELAWPKGFTVDQALMALGLPAFLLPGRR